jgi:hypothetical protein
MDTLSSAASVWREEESNRGGRTSRAWRYAIALEMSIAKDNLNLQGKGRRPSIKLRRFPLGTYSDTILLLAIESFRFEHLCIGSGERRMFDEPRGRFKSTLSMVMTELIIGWGKWGNSQTPSIFFWSHA